MFQKVHLQSFLKKKAWQTNSQKNTMLIWMFQTWELIQSIIVWPEMCRTTNRLKSVFESLLLKIYVLRLRNVQNDCYSIIFGLKMMLKFGQEKNFSPCLTGGTESWFFPVYCLFCLKKQILIFLFDSYYCATL